MGRVLDLARTYGGVQGWAEVVSYLKEGDPAALSGIKDAKPRGLRALGDVVAAPDALEEEDRRALHALAAGDELDAIAAWLDRSLPAEGPDQDFFGIAMAELRGRRVRPRQLLAPMVAMARDGRPNSAGRALLNLSDDDLVWCLDAREYDPRDAKLELLFDAAPDRVPAIFERAIKPDDFFGWRVPLRRDPGRYVEPFLAAIPGLESLRYRYYATRLLLDVDLERFRPMALEAARRMIAEGLEWEHDAADAMERFGVEVRDALITYLTTPSRELSRRGLTFQIHRVLSDTCEILGRGAIPAVLAHYRAIGEENIEDRPDALGHLIDLDDGTHAELIREGIDRGLDETRSDRPATFQDFVDLATKWGPERLSERLWELARDPAKKVRDAVVPVLARLGDETARPRAVAMLEESKGADVRATAVALLAALGTPAALDTLEARRDVEPSEDVRDAILRALDAAGRPAVNPDLAANLARVAGALKKPIAPWADEAKLPPLRDRDGGPLGAEATRYLLYRQSRAKEIAPDIEARALYDRIEPASGADFAAALLDRYLAAGGKPDGRWALAVAGLLGDARVVPVLSQGVATWVKGSRLAMAESAVQALALVGDESTLAALDALGRRYRVKPKPVAEAAHEALRAAAGRLGLSLDDLGDRVVPALGFEPGKARIVEAGGKRIEASVGPDFKLRYRDPATGKAVKSLPSSVAKEVKGEFKDLAAALREAAAAQAARLEDMLVRGRRWPASRWRELFLGHAVLFPFAVRLVWGRYDEAGALRGTFRALEDRTLTDADSNPVAPPGSVTVGIVHPLELDDATRNAWRVHLADYEVTPPFPQMDRPVVRVPEDERPARFLRAVRGTKLEAQTFKGRAERLGWVRGPVLDNGSVHAYLKRSPAGVDAVVALEGMSVQPFEDQEATLGLVGFFRTGEWTGFHYDSLPREESDARLVPLGEVPPILYSEVMGDLRKIAGQGEEESS